ncbi:MULTISPECIES: Mrp/NBP35 family ATP-binding protein [unclassified Aureispira]|uniref:Mrp/NBP35 family ATP-binding protein n=1 Tax=unclassified Aureispira TaxID=2649989 RepID=UPI00069602A9|nr:MULTISPECIES: Mrp/NBP35 family ATP-binding protein [unclassified Aureispira]WMX16675.1 Mrp/NBP35 family ATP-binding protein [Aureispira sp. CCB-E]
MEFDKSKIIEALRTVNDPDTGQDIISVRMVENLQVKGKDISFTIIVPSLKSPIKNQLTFACIGAVNSVYPEAEVHVHSKPREGGETNRPQSPVPHIKNIIAVASGKGGVGKSTVAVNLALSLKAMGASVGLMDIDLYGPSIPTMLGMQGQRPKIQDVHGKPKMVPIEKFGIPTISIGYMIEPQQAVVLRGPRLGGIVKQFFQECLWPKLDYLILDLPPGTGDIHLTLVQTVPVTGIVMVTTPQEVAYTDAIKGMNMFRLENINVPILGVVENMAWFTPKELPNNKYYIFGEGGGKRLAKEANTMLLGQIPIVQGIREGGDKGVPAAVGEEPISKEAFLNVAKNVLRQVAVRNEMIEATKVVKTT